MTTDYATCHAYFDLKAAYHSIADPVEATHALGGLSVMGMEGRRMETLANLSPGSFDRRRKAVMADMQKTLDISGFSALYSAYDGFCDSLKDDPGKHFLRHLPREELRRSPRRSMKEEVL